MNLSASLEWWPERQLRRSPIDKIFVCGQQFHPPPLAHVVNFPRLEIPLNGCYENLIESDGQAVTVRLQPGTALFAAPNCWNLPTWRRNVKLMSLLFGKKQLGISIVTARGPDILQLVAQKFSTPWPLTGPLPHILEAMVQLQPGGVPQEAFTCLAQALIRCVRELIQHPAQPMTSRAQGLLESVCVYLQNHYQYDITRDSVARQFEITPNHLSRLFQSHGHMTFSNYLTHVRLDRAKHLLRNYNLKLDEITIRCGYCDTPYFCRVFKRIAKMTPAEYRVKTRVPSASDAGKPRA
jgi:AraC-like DNA-binding protein